MAKNKIIEKSRKSAEWKAKDGRGFRITEQSTGKTDVVFFKGNKSVAHLSLDSDVFEAFKEKVKGF